MKSSLRMIHLTSVYLAGSFLDRARLRGVRAELEQMGVTCTARWLDAPEDGDLAEWAFRDLVDLRLADTLIIFTDVPSSSGGYWWEFGFAYALDKTIVLIGPRTNLFCHISIEYRFDSFAALRAQIAPMEVARAHAD